MTPVAEDRALLRALEEEIPVLEEKLRAMKVARRNLKSSVRMKQHRQNTETRARNREAIQKHRAKPEERERWAVIRNDNNPLPFRKGTPARALYANMRRKGATRELAIEIVNTEAHSE